MEEGSSSHESAEGFERVRDAFVDALRVAAESLATGQPRPGERALGSTKPVIDRAIEVIGDREKALRWMGTPVRALDYATPISLLSRPDGEERVMTVLMQLEHGVF